MKFKYYWLGVIAGIIGMIFWSWVLPPPYDRLDVNHDGKVDIADWSIMDARVFPPNK